jgi:hypothetical protein
MRDPGTLRAVEVNHPSHEGWRTARRWPRRSCRTGRRAAGEGRQVRRPPYTRRGRLESQDPSAAQTNVPSRTRTTSREHPGSAGPDGHKAHIGRHGDVPLRGGRPGGDATAARNPTCSPAEVDEREERPTVPLPLTSHRLRALSLTLAADVQTGGRTRHAAGALRSGTDASPGAHTGRCHRARTQHRQPSRSGQPPPELSASREDSTSRRPRRSVGPGAAGRPATRAHACRSEGRRELPIHTARKRAGGWGRDGHRQRASPRTCTSQGRGAAEAPLGGAPHATPAGPA